MNLKTTVILFGVLIGVLFIFALTQFLGTRPPGEGDEWAFPELHQKKKEIDASEIKTIQIERTLADKSESITFERDKLAWMITKPYSARTDNYAVESMINGLIKAQREKSDMSSNRAEYGLENPAVIVTLSDGTTQWTLNLGKQSPGESDPVVYAFNSLRPKTLFAIRKKGGLEGLYKPLLEFRSKELLTLNSFNAQEINLDAPNTQAIGLQKDAAGQWRFSKPSYFGLAEAQGENQAAADPTKPTVIEGVQQLIEALNSLRVETDKDFKADGVSDDDLASQYGLARDKPAGLRVEIKRNPPPSVNPEEEKPSAEVDTLLIGNKVPAPKPEKPKDDKKPEATPPAESSEYYYARLSGENSVLALPAKKVEPLLNLVKDPIKLRDHSLVRLPSSATVDAVDIKNSYGLLKLRLKSQGVVKNWDLYRANSKGLATDESSVQALLRDLATPKLIKSFPDPQTKLESYDLDKPTVVVSLWVDGLVKEEKKAEEKKPEAKEDDAKKDEAKPAEGKKPDIEKSDKKSDDAKKVEAEEPKLKTDKPTIKLSYGKVDRDKGIVYVLREMGEEKTIVTLAADKMDLVIRGPLAYFNRQMPKFGDDPAIEAKELTLIRAGTMVKLEKAKKDSQEIWKFKEPKEMAGRIASPNALKLMLLSLRRLDAVRLAAENPPKSEWDPIYGLLHPDVELRILAKGKDGKDEEFVYSFGKESADKAGIFARSNKSNLVYVVNKATVDLFKADLRDPAIISFDPAALRKIKLTGWKGNLLKPSVVELERKEAGVWKSDFVLNSARAEEFMNLLKNLQAVRFLTATEAAKVDRNKFDPANDGLLIELAIDKIKDPIHLYLGNPDPENKYIQATQDPKSGAIFLLPLDKFKEIKTGPKYFEAAKP